MSMYNELTNTEVTTETPKTQAYITTELEITMIVVCSFATLVLVVLLALVIRDYKRNEEDVDDKEVSTGGKSNRSRQSTFMSTLPSISSNEENKNQSQLQTPDTDRPTTKSLRIQPTTAQPTSSPMETG